MNKRKRGKGAAYNMTPPHREREREKQGEGKGEEGKEREVKEGRLEGGREIERECQGIMKLPVYSKEGISKVDPPVPATPATTTWIRDQLPSQVHCEFLTHKTVNK